jgi:hypothetical protein
MSEPATFNQRTRDNLRQQLSKALPVEYPSGGPQDWASVYIPSSHLRALSPRSMVVEGMRGSGKSFWTSVLSDQALRGNLMHEHLDAEFHEEMNAIVQTKEIALDKSGTPFPKPQLLTNLLAIPNISPELIWQVALLRLFPIDPELGMPSSSDKFDAWTAVMQWAGQHAGRVATAVDLLDDELHQSQQATLVVIDALDRVSGQFELVTQMTAGLLRVMVQLRFAKALRLKVFLREDILSRAGPSVIDGSKILNNSARLEWSQGDLYGLLGHTWLQHQQASTVRSQFERLTRTKVQQINDAYTSISLRDEVSQETFWIALIGDYMGRSATTGHTYPYMYNHLADAKGRVAPRTFLAAAAYAVDQTQKAYADKLHVIHHEAIRDGVRYASESRTRELEEDYRWIRPALTAIKEAGYTVPIDLNELQKVWRAKNANTLLDIEKMRETALLPWPDNSSAQEQIRLLYETLEQIGVTKIRLRHGVERVDLPDIYRLSYKIGRHGGIPTHQKKT